MSFKVITMVAIRDNCKILTTVHPDADQVDFLVGPTAEAFEFGFDRACLTRFVQLAQAALTQLDAA
ncbi:hypothetical protein [Actinokineospora inagensis]|uniref:hypothetical protein n=1 Tax=Actinokineospora inagensis TaxID=103730 RepID=UPI0004125114|nr:hypothetical protein [Actinokineospora inagensis]